MVTCQQLNASGLQRGGRSVDAGAQLEELRLAAAVQASSVFELAAHGVQLGEEQVEGRDGVLVGAGVFDELLRADDRLGDRGGAINGRSDIDDRAADLAAQVAGPARVVDNVLRSISRL